MPDVLVVNLDVMAETYDTYKAQRDLFAEDIVKLKSIIQVLDQSLITAGGEKAIEEARTICKQAEEKLQQLDAAAAFVNAKYEGYLAVIAGKIV